MLEEAVEAERVLELILVYFQELELTLLDLTLVYVQAQVCHRLASSSFVSIPPIFYQDCLPRLLSSVSGFD